MIPGEYLLEGAAIEANAGRRTTRVLVKNTGDRPIQVGSHYHFFESNRFLEFDHAAAYGMRLNIAAGTAVRFEPGEEKMVELTEFGGAQVIHGFNALVEGRLQAPGKREQAMARCREANFLFPAADTGKVSPEREK